MVGRIRQKQLLELQASEELNAVALAICPICMREIPPITCEAGIYVLAGMGGLSINEAMCFGKPIICSVADGTEKRLVREGYNGHYFESGSVPSLVSTIEKLFKDLAQIQVMGQRSKEIIQQEINIHTVLGNYMEAFKFVNKVKITRF
jgi:glycosyltransferase involved in cell wall biosynthesis